MSSLKYDEAAAEQVIKTLEEASQILTDVNRDVQAFIDGVPSDTVIENAITSRSYKTRYFEDGTSEEYLDEGTRSYYRSKYKNPINTASSNLTSIVSNISSLKSDLDDTDSRVHKIAELVSEYEGTTVNEVEPVVLPGSEFNKLSTNLGSEFGGDTGTGGGGTTVYPNGGGNGGNGNNGGGGTTVYPNGGGNGGNGTNGGENGNGTNGNENGNGNNGGGNGDGKDIFNKGDAEKGTGGFGDNIEGKTGGNGNNGNGSGNGAAGGLAGIWAGTGADSNNQDIDSIKDGLFSAINSDGSTSSDGKDSDFIFRGLYDQKADDNVDVGSINYKALGDASSGVAKGAAVAGAVGLGVSGMDAVATFKEHKKQNTLLKGGAGEEDEDKKFVKTVISCSILALVSMGFIFAILMPNVSVLAVILLGLAMAISSVSAATGLKIGKYVGFGVLLLTTLITFVLSVTDVISPVGYIVIFGAFVVLTVATCVLDLLKGMFEDKIDLVPILIAIDVGLLFGMFKVLDVINWLLLLILLLLTVGGYFLWEKVIKYKLPDDDDDDEYVDNVIYKPAQYVENSPMNSPKQEAFDPRSLYEKEENKPALDGRMSNVDQNPFANYNPLNGSFENAFKNDKNDNNNNNGNTNGLF